ncbi:AAA family ATPase [Alienimonas californiensis]|uniref:Recombination protein F n=1 Tax=Alienimonas californiensis TaxID=2527989 RepID=A0A517P724_9PLAN|nr:AAA family ATPase [Alienimonas californiensis]QDT15152.1 recombination protein F [Alienimonas californiensis]
MSKVVRLTADNFRGMHTEVELGLSDKNGKATSALLLGENGSGKSSLVDAIQLVLQGFVGRDTSTKRSLGGLLPISSDRSASELAVELDDGRTIRASIIFDEGGDGKLSFHWHTPTGDFRGAPLVLRRADVLKFWDVPEERRQSLFFDTFRLKPGSGPASTPQTAIGGDEELHLVMRRRVQIKEHRRILHRWVREQAGIDDPNQLPITGKGFIDGCRRHRIAFPTPRNRVEEWWKLQPPEREAVEEACRRIALCAKWIKETEENIRFLESKGQDASSDVLTRTNQALLKISAAVGNAFREISTAASRVGDFKFSVGDLSKSSLEVHVLRSDGTLAYPRDVLSEANLDLVALLYYVEAAAYAAEQGQSRVLILDDVFQSVDATIRVRASEYLLRRLAGWQLLFTCHDRLWAEHILATARRTGMPMACNQVRYDSSMRTVVLQAELAGPKRRLLSVLESGDPGSICSAAGLMLEKLCDHLSVSLQTSVTRRPNDRYTLGDLWPGVYKKLKKTNLEEVLRTIDSVAHLRNSAGAHYNEWAQNLSESEAATYGNAVAELEQMVLCGRCQQWISATHANPEIRCRCGNLKYE